MENFSEIQTSIATLVGGSLDHLQLIQNPTLICSQHSTSYKGTLSMIFSQHSTFMELGDEKRVKSLIKNEALFWTIWWCFLQKMPGPGYPHATIQVPLVISGKTHRFWSPTSSSLKVVAWPVCSTINVSFFKTQWLGFSTSHAVGHAKQARKGDVEGWSSAKD